MRKQIYIKDQDQAIFDRAVELAGEENLSGTITEAIRRFVEQEEALSSGLQEITLEIGNSGREGESDDYRKIRFIGKKLATADTLCGSNSSGDDRGVDYALYHTGKGKFLLHREDWTKWQGEQNTKSYIVYDSLEEIKNAPGQLIQDAANKLGTEVVEMLDI